MERREFVEVVGERIALLGSESGTFECWMWPLKLFHDLRIEAWKPGGEPIRFPARVDATERGLALRILAPRDERGLVLLFASSDADAIEVDLGFACDFRPMWPAGLGGQIAAPDPETGALVLTEELGRFAALIGGIGAELDAPAGDHALSKDRVHFRLRVPSEEKTVAFVVAGAEVDPGPLDEEAKLGRRGAAKGFGRSSAAVSAARALWKQLQARWPDVEKAEAERWRAFHERTAVLDDSAHRLGPPFEGSKTAIERAWVKVDGVGRGLVAGLGESRGGERPGFAWFFDGDAMVASRSMAAYGDFDGAREVLRFAASHQRADGKLMHELTLSARLCHWVEDYPYAYYKGMNAADFVAALEHFVRWSGDLALACELFPNVARAIEWCASTCGPDGLMSNRKAGLAAVEAGALVERIECDVFLQGAWIAALRAGARLASDLGEQRFRQRCEDLARTANRGLARMWIPEKERFAFAALEDGALAGDLSAYLALAALHADDEAKSRATAAQLNRPEVSSDWGLRMFATDSAVYDPRNYNTGSVFPYLTSFAVQALFARGLPMAARQILDSQYALWSTSSRGFVEEHFAGDRFEIPERGVPHQIFSSAALIEPAIASWLGIRPDAVAKRLVIGAQLGPEPAEVRVDRLRVGETTLDLSIRREPRKSGGTATIYRLRRIAGPLLSVEIRQPLAPLSRRIDERSAGELEVAIEELEGPAAIFPSSLPERGGTSRNPRISDVRALGDHEVEWTLHGIGGTRAELPFHCDLPCEVSAGPARLRGRELLEVSFDGGSPGAFVEAQLRLRTRDR